MDKGYELNSKKCNIKYVKKWEKMGKYLLFYGYCMFYLLFSLDLLTHTFRTLYNGKKRHFIDYEGLESCLIARISFK
jgi:hypothetical protein